MRTKYFLPLMVVLVGVSFPPHALAATSKLLFVQNYTTHKYDVSIKQMLGFESATIAYLKEIASITPEESNLRGRYESIGCYPFYVMQNGLKKELGFDCRTFYCAGFLNGPEQCRDMNDNPYGGTVEINTRLSTSAFYFTHIPFQDLPPELQTQRTKYRWNIFTSVGCAPYFIAEFEDVIVGEGYQCDERGKYPFFSAARSCFNMFDGAVLNPSANNTYKDGYDFLCSQMSPGSSRDATIDSTPTGSPFDPLPSNFSFSAGAIGQSTSSNQQSSRISDNNSFSDVPESNWAYTEIISLRSRGIIQGYEDGSYRPNNTVNRAELTKFLIAGLHAEEDKGESNCFPDVKDEWFARYVCSAKRLKWVNGYPDLTFKPANTVNRAEAMKIIISSITSDFSSTAQLPNDVTDNEWYAQYIRKAVELGIITESRFEPAKPLTRDYAAKYIYRAIK